MRHVKISSQVYLSHCKLTEAEPIGSGRLFFVFSVTASPSRKAHPDGCSQKPIPANNLPETNSPVSFAPDAVGVYLIRAKQYSQNIFS